MQGVGPGARLPRLGSLFHAALCHLLLPCASVCSSVKREIELPYRFVVRLELTHMKPLRTVSGRLQ